MQRASRITSHRLRMATIAALMFLLLAASLGVAKLLVDHRSTSEHGSASARFHAGELSFELPTNLGLGLETSSNTNPSQGTALTIKGFSAPLQLNISLLPQQVVSPPWFELQSRATFDNEPNPQPFRPLTQPISGQFLRSHATVGYSNTQDKPQLKGLALLTLDGSRYWQITLSMDLSDKSIDPQQAARQAMGLLEFMAKTSNDEAFHIATKDDFERAGIARGRFMEHWHVLAPIARTAEPCLYLIPRDHKVQLRLVRIRSTVFTGNLPPSDEFSAANLLFQQGSWLADGKLLVEPKLLRLNQSEAWHLPISYPTPETMARELCYLQYGNQSAAVAEIRWEDHPGMAIESWIEQLLYSLDFAYSTTLPSADQQLRTMLERGRELLNQQGKIIDKQINATTSYDLMEISDLPPLVRINYFAGSTIPDAITRQGWTRTYFNRNDEPTLALQQTWSGTTDGSVFRLLTARSPLSPTLGQSRTVPLPQIKPGSPANMSLDIFALESGALRQAVSDNGREKQVWARRVPPNYLPVIFDDLWPLESFFRETDQINSDPKLLWITRDRLPPTPCVVHAVGFGPAKEQPKITSSSENEVYLWIRLRPLAGLESNLLGLNHQGMVVQSLMQTPRGPMFVRRTNRQELLASQPWINKALAELQTQQVPDNAKGSTP